jgi:hypothetical protein
MTPRHTSAENVYFDIDDASGPIRVFVSPRAGIQTDAILLGSELEVVGVLGQETSGKLPDRGYRLWPRAPADLRIVAAAPGVAAGSTSGAGGEHVAGSNAEPGSGAATDAAGAPAGSGPAKQQRVPRLHAPAPTAPIASALPQPGAPAAIRPEEDAADGSPAKASAALLVLAALLLGGGGVVTGPPGLVGRLLAQLRERLGGPGGTGESEPPGGGSPLGTTPRLVPLTLAEDVHERGGRILPPT